MIIWDEKDRLEILKSSFSEVHGVRRESEQLENKVGSALITGLVILSIFILKGDISIPENNILLFDTVVILFSIFGCSVLYRNLLRIKSCCRILVRIELALDLYRPNAYFTDEELEQIPCEEGYGKSVYPDFAKEWGMDEFRLNGVSFMGGVILAAILVVISAHMSTISETTIVPEEVTSKSSNKTLKLTLDRSLLSLPLQSVAVKRSLA